MSKMLRISSDINQQIEDIQKIYKITKQEIVKKAVERLAREIILQETNKAFENLKSEKKAWSQELQERQEWLLFENDNDHNE